MEMLSTPPATTQSAPSPRMWFAAMAIVCRPEEQKRFTLVPAVVFGMPASSAARRAMFGAAWALLPKMQSSTKSASTPDLATACLIACAAIDIGGVTLNPPRPDLARPVRA